MTKPEGVSASAWEKAYDWLADTETTAVIQGIDFVIIREAFARAIDAAQKAAYEEAAIACDRLSKIKRDVALDDAGLGKYRAANHWDAEADGCDEAAEAIRKLGSE